MASESSLHLWASAFRANGAFVIFSRVILMCGTFGSITNVLFSAVEPVDSRSNNQSMSLAVSILLQSLDAAAETYGMRHIISHGTLELITQLMPKKNMKCKKMLWTNLG